MESARRLAEHGHKVTLIEKGPVLGGTLRFAALAYQPNQGLLEWLIKEVERLPIEVLLNTEATPSMIERYAPDALIMANGATRFMPDIPGNDGSNVYSGEDMRRLMLGDFDQSLLKKTSWLTRALVGLGNTTGLIRKLDLVRRISHFWMPLGHRIVIVGGDLVGLELAEFLHERGRDVTVLHEEPRMGSGLTLVRRLRLLAELKEHGVRLSRGVSEVRFEGSAAHYRNGRGEQKQVPADSIIVARGAGPNLSLAAEGANTVYTIGDSQGVGYIEGAMRDAMRACDQIMSS
jgi:NADPH-dependent 2,4-dienoyl-CoA reductase/sulfur reductase-like enzyme